jgi:hypothetical protein
LIAPIGARVRSTSGDERSGRALDASARSTRNWRSTSGSIYGRSAAELLRLQRITARSSPETTSGNVHHDDHELAAEHRQIERLHSDPLARRQEQRGERHQGKSR